MDRVDIAILGGGIAGLAALFRVKKLSPHARVVLFEAGPSAGGRLGSARIAGLTVDTAADAFLARVAGAVELATELGLGDELVAPATGQAAVVVHGELRALPGGLVLGVPTDLDALAHSAIMSAEGLRIAASDATTARPYSLPGDRSVADAIGSHLGSEVVDRLVDPLLGGISAANSARLSIEAVSPLIANAAREPHLMDALVRAQAVAAQGQIGVTEQRPVFLAPRSGVHQLVAALTVEVSEHIRLSTPVRSLTAEHDHWVIGTDSGPVAATQIIAATPAYATARLLADQPELAAKLRSIRYASVALIVMAYRRADAHLPPGSGVLVPRVEQRLVTAASWWDQKWPHLRHDDVVLIRASVGRIDDVRFQNMTDADLVAAGHQDLATMIGVRLDAPPVDNHVARWNDSFAQYDVGHLGRVDEMMSILPAGLHLAGAPLRGVGLPACIRSADAAALAATSALA